MELVLTLNTQIARVNDALMATLTLRNDSEAAVLVNTRLVVNRAGAPAGFRDVSFNVTGPDGEALPLAVGSGSVVATGLGSGTGSRTGSASR